MATDNIFIKQLGLDSHRELYELDPEKVVDGLDEMDIDIQSGDAFLTVVQLRANADIRKSVGALEAGTKALERATWILVVLGIASLLVAAAALVVALASGG